MAAAGTIKHSCLLARRASFDVARSDYPEGVSCNSPGSRRFVAHPGSDRNGIVPRRGSIVPCGAGCNPSGVMPGWCREPRVRDEAPRPWAIRLNPFGVVRTRNVKTRVGLTNLVCARHREKYSVFAYTVRMLLPTSKKVPSFSSFDRARSGYFALIWSAVWAFASISSGNTPVAPM